MLKLIKANIVYYFFFLLLLVAGLIIYLQGQHGDAVLYFATLRDETLDFTFMHLTKVGEAFIYIIAIAILIFINLRYALLVPIVALATLVFSLSLKALFGTPRPVTYFYKEVDAEMICLIPGLYMNVGYNSFPSGHSMSAFAIFTFLTLCIANKKWAFLLIIPAVLVAFSRVVITQHFLNDILAGSSIGLVLGTLIFYWQSRYPVKIEKWYDQPVTKDRLMAWLKRDKSSNA